MRWTMLAVMGCAEAPEEAPAPTVPVDYGVPGPFPVGTSTLEITGSDGLLLTVQIWYPGAEEGAATVMYDDLWPGGAFEGIAADCSAVRPLLAFSHGFAGVRWQSPFLTEHLASHGYVVVAPDHRGNTFTDLTGDILELGVRRPQDVVDAVDALPETIVADCLDPAQGFAIAGHSFGGYTTLALAGAAVNDALGGGELDLGDERVWAALALAPWDAAGALTGGTSEIEVPTMILASERDEITPIGQVRSVWAPMVATPRWLGVFPEGGHFSFSPIACTLGLTDGCGELFLDEATFTRLVATAGLAFLEGAGGSASGFEGIPLDAEEIQWESAR